MTVLSTLRKETTVTMEAGLIIAVMMTGWKFQSIYQNIANAVYKDFKKASTYYIETSYRLHQYSASFHKSRFFSALTRILAHPRIQISIALFQYFIRFPLFVAWLRIMLKTIAAFICKRNKFAAIILTFIASFICQLKFQVFHWKWILFLLIRSVYSLLRLLVPNDLQPPVQYTYAVIHAICGMMLTWHYAYVPHKWWSLFENCLNEERTSALYMFSHNHRISTPCKLLHYHSKDRCLKAFVSDNVRRVPHILMFFGQFYTITTLLNVPKWIKAIRKRQLNTFFVSLIKDLLGSSAFFLVTAFSFRLPCLFTVNGKTCINKAMFVSINILLGYVAILCESKSRRLMVALSCVWNISQQLIRMMFNLKTQDNEKYHKTLSSNKFGAFLFGINMMVIMFVYHSNPKAVKSMERRIITKYF
eukprot:812099_1